MIPRRMTFFWTGGPMSWLRYMTIKSFCDLNPEWVVHLAMIDSKVGDIKPWDGPEVQDAYNYSGRDWTEEAKQITSWSRGCIRQTAPPQFQADLSRWGELEEEPGWFSDMDILYVKPMDEVYEAAKESPFVHCSGDGHLSMGLLASSKNGNQFFKDLFEYTAAIRDFNNYQVGGVSAMYDILTGSTAYQPETDYGQLIKEKYGPFFNLPMNAVYPFRWFKTGELWLREHTELPPECIGIHWFAGSPLSQRWNLRLTPENVGKYHNTMARFLQKANR